MDIKRLQQACRDATPVPALLHVKALPNETSWVTTIRMKCLRTARQAAVRLSQSGEVAWATRADNRPAHPVQCLKR